MKRLRLLSGVVVSFLLLLLVLRGLDWRAVIITLNAADYRYLVPATLMLLAALGAKTLRWRYLLEPIEVLPIGRLWPMVLIGFFSNQFLPSNSGELIRVYVLGKREQLSHSAVLATVVTEKMMDVATLILWLLIVLLFPLPGWVRASGVVAGAFFASAGVLLGILNRQEERIGRWLAMLASRVSPMLAEKLITEFSTFVRGLRSVPRDGRLALAVLVSTLFWGTLSVAYYFIGLSLHFTAPLYAFALTSTLVGLGAVIPAVFGSLGRLEFICVSALGLFGIELSRALTFVVLLRAVRLLPTILGSIYLYREGFRPAGTQRVLHRM